MGKPSRAGREPAGCDDFVSLRVEGDLRNLALVADQYRLASARVRVIHTRRPVSGRGDQFASLCVECNVQDLVVVAPQGVHALAR